MPRHDYLPENFKPLTENASYFKKPALCPECEGHGGWVIKRDAYGKGKHFQAHCMQCNGWGKVEAASKDANCIHEFSTGESIGNCLHLWTCKKCGKAMQVDSSG